MSAPRLHKKYEEEIQRQVMERFSIDNVMAAPRLQKIVVNMGVGDAKDNKEVLKEAAAHLAQITGQKAAITRARRSIAGFKLREGMNVGLKVTLRRDRMYEFLDRLICVAIPRVRDFRGLSRKAFDGRGNYSMGLSEQTVFPEVDIDKVSRIQGMNVTMVTSAPTDEQAEALLEGFGLPFQRN